MSEAAWEAGMNLIMAIPDIPERLAAFKALIAAEEKAGEAITTAYTDAGIFDGIADDLIEMCGNGTQHLYAANVGSDLSETVLGAYDIACPE